MGLYLGAEIVAIKRDNNVRNETSANPEKSLLSNKSTDDNDDSKAYQIKCFLSPC